MPESYDEIMARTIGTIPVPVTVTESTRNTPKPGKAGARFRLMARFWNHPSTPTLSHAAKACWCYLWMLSDARRTCYPSLGRIRRRLGCSRRYAVRLVAELIHNGYLEIVCPGSNLSGNRANVYRIRLPKSTPEPVPPSEPECTKVVNQSAP